MNGYKEAHGAHTQFHTVPGKLHIDALHGKPHRLLGNQHHAVFVLEGLQFPLFGHLVLGGNVYTWRGDLMISETTTIFI